MGINDFKRIKQEFIQQTNLNKLRQYTDKRTKVKVYVDGSFYRYTGYISNNLNNEGSAYIPQRVAETAVTLIYNSVSRIEKIKDVIGVYVFFDGIRPTSKTKTSTIRQMRKTPKKNAREVLNCMMKLLNDHNYIINNLVIGESEHEMFLHRDPNYPSILLSDDSDLFHISFQYSSITVNDVIFIVTKSLRTSYDITQMSKELRNVPKLIFTILCCLKGSDYTHSAFTTTMFLVLLKTYCDRQYMSSTSKAIMNDINDFCDNFKKMENKTNIHVKKVGPMTYNKLDEDDYDTIPGIFTINDVCWCIKQLLLLLGASTSPFVWNNDKYKNVETYAESIQSIKDQLESIVWFVNYSFLGCKYDKYFEPVTFPSSLSHFRLYLFILQVDYDDDIYDKLINTHLENTDKKQFLKTLKDDVNVSTQEATKAH
ncbi:hypothetical protein HgNV_013 [Homarus gammarus nudivirus]|uniref:Uncharacterized protein n=1 Tax=Homarus gammarus nudivirus TaxID=2509616 RepID=A0A411HB45_9VIRU|nr:hypothetical protein KM727_gp13 [Homarus gammarus nudivirus]QBB28618.1 hypothetical protein HgNV_013 [Homarus gammarus nudivirus]